MAHGVDVSHAAWRPSTRIREGVRRHVPATLMSAEQQQERQALLIELQDVKGDHDHVLG